MQNSQKSTPNCINNKNVYQVCFNPKCQQSCFICDNKCTCKDLHKECDKIDWYNITNKLNRDIIKNTKEFQSFFQKVDQLYQNTMKVVKQAYENFKLWERNFGLTKLQTQFLKQIDEGRFKDMTSPQIYQIRKQIRKSSKLIIKSRLDEQAEQINTSTKMLIQQLKGLYSSSLVIKEAQQQKVMIKPKDDNLPIIPNVTFLQKILGLNENGSKFFISLNEGVFEKQLEKLIQKINLNSELINYIKQTMIENKHTTEMRIEKLTETVAGNSQKLRQQISTQAKIEKLESLLKLKLDIIKYKLITNVNVVFNLKSFPSYILFQDSITALSQTLKSESQNKYSILEEKLTHLMKDHSQNKISTQNLNQQYNKLEEEAQRNRKEMDIKINMEVGNIKINAISMFFTKKIKKLTLLYKASENNFQISKFWDKCNSKTNTVIILKTQFGKIIGGYTPLAWNKALGKHQQDTSKQTFLFSITQKHKIPISQNQQYAVCHNVSYGPSFGNYDIYICDKANVTGSSYGNIGYTYNNGEYTYNNQQSYKKWSGQTNGSTFFIQQWEVYEITF